MDNTAGSFKLGQELVKCSSKKTCNTRCKCKKFALPCTEHVCVPEVAECQIGQKYSVTLHVIGTENMILSLDGCFCFKFIIVLRTLLFSIETLTYFFNEKSIYQKLEAGAP